MKLTGKKILAMVLALCMVVGMVPAMTASAQGPELEITTTYSQSGFTFEKVSHAASGTETADGVVDYLGDHQVVPYVDGESEVGHGDSVQSYSYCAAASGDWVYIGTMYGALSAAAQIKRALGDVPPEVANAVVDAMYNGKLNKGQEEDGYYAGSVFFKFNVKTGETKILMSRPMFEQGLCEGVPIFRSAVEYNGKLYFVGLVSNGTALDRYNGMPLNQAYALNLEIMMQTGVPSIYEVDPTTDTVTKVYECVDVEGYRLLNGNMDTKSVFTSTRAIGTFQDYLIAGGIQVDARYPEGRPDGYAAGDACILASGNPSSGDFKVIATMGDLYDYPAIWRDGSSGGGGIYQVVEYNGSLYVAIVSGTRDTMSEETHQFRPFAVVRGDYDETKGAIDEREAWTWTPVIGDLADGAKYTFGIDPQRTASSACTLQPYGGYLYIGEYNDVNGSLRGILVDREFATLAANLEQSINLYRMDENEDIEMVVGDATEMYPEGSISGWGSGYATHMTQYTWMTTVYDGTMYLSTMDETSLTRPLADVASGEWTKMSPEEWKSQINYLKVLLELLGFGQKDTDPNALVRGAMASCPVTLTADQQKTLTADLESGAIIPGMLSEDDEVLDNFDELVQGLEMLQKLLTSTSTEEFVELYTQLLAFYEDALRAQLPDSAQQVIDMLLNYATEENLKDLKTCLGYMQEAEAGFDLYAIDQNPDGSVDITAVTTNGFNDRYNHGLRIFAATTDYMVIGTANPFYGTQLWRMSQHPYRHCHFVDVPEDAYYYDAVYWAAKNDITNGTSATTFSPEAPVTRGQMVTFLYRLAGEPEVEVGETFTDVVPGSYYEPAVAWALENEITKGTSETTFEPGRTCTRAEIVTFLYRYEQQFCQHGAPIGSVELPEMPFEDVPESAYYYEAVQWAVANEITLGTTETTFSPKAPCTRAQAVTFLYRYTMLPVV